MNANWLRALFVMAALTLAADKEAFACSCVMNGPPCQATWNADAVFSGTVRSIERIEGTNDAGYPSTSEVVRFDVEQAFIGLPARPQDLASNPMSTCHYRFQAGKKYLVYAAKGEGGQLSASICSRTRLLADAAEDLRYLKSMPASGSGGRIYGRVTESRRDPAEEMPVDNGPVERVTVNVRGATFLRDVVTDAHGRFEVPNLPTGKFTVTVVPAPGFDARYLERELEVGDPRACGVADFTLSQIAVATGSVVDASGRPASGVEVEAVAAELAGFNPPPYQHPVRTNEHGLFEFEDLPPGSYVFGIGLTKRPGAPAHAGAVFLPGTAAARDAAVIELKPGERRELGVLRLVER